LYLRLNNIVSPFLPMKGEIKNMRVILLNEGSRPNEIGYHFTDIDGLTNILKDNFMEATNDPLEDNYNITRYKLTFPDGSELNIDYDVMDSLNSYFKENSDEAFDKLINNRLKEKIKRFDIKSKDEIRIKEYEYTPYKNLIGKKSWSYTRRPEGMSYRNFKTFGENTVRIGIDIDKLTEKGYKIVPFSWMRIRKKSRGFEYEERVFGKGEKENGTSNFMDFVTEIAFNTELNDETLIIHSSNFSHLNTLIFLKKRIKEAEKILNISSNSDSKISHNHYHKLLLDINSCLDKIGRRFTKIKDVEDFYEISEDIDDIREKLFKANPNIKIVFADPDSGDPVLTDTQLKDDIDRFLSLIKAFKEETNSDLKSDYNFESDYSFNKDILKDSRCKKEFDKLLDYIEKVLTNFDLDYCKKILKEVSDKYNEAYRKDKEQEEKELEKEYQANEKEWKKFLQLISKWSFFKYIKFNDYPALFLYDTDSDRKIVQDKYDSNSLELNPISDDVYYSSVSPVYYLIKQLVNNLYSKGYRNILSYKLGGKLSKYPDGSFYFYILTVNNVYEITFKLTEHKQFTFSKIKCNGKILKSLQDIL